MRVFAASGGLITRNYVVVRGLVMQIGCWCREGVITRNEVVCVVWGCNYAKRGGLCVIMRNEVVCVVRGLGYMKWECWWRLRARLHETRQLASLGGLGYAKRGVGIVWGCDYAKQGDLRRLGAWLHKIGGVVSI
jgi:hypothetical protein